MDIASSQLFESKFVNPVHCFAERPWILVADDESTILELLVEILASDGFEVMPAANGFELFEVLRRARGDGYLPTLIISDVCMPGMTGLQLLQKIRDWDLPVPVILITGFVEAEALVEAQRLGAFAVLPKPFALDDFRTAVNYVMTRPDRAISLSMR